MQKFKMTNRDIYLTIGFVVCCIIVAGLIGDLVVHSKTYPISSSTTQWIVISSDGTGIYCTSEMKHWKARSNGICYSADSE